MIGRLRSHFIDWSVHTSALLITLAFLLMRAIVAPQFGLGGDEAHYVLYGKYLDWSYFDHPPLVGWVQAVFIQVFGYTEFSARFPAMLLSAITSLLCYLFVLEIGKNRLSALMAMIALNCSFIYCGLSFMFLPDTLLLPLYFLIILLVVDIAENPSLLKWLTLGVLLGLAGLSKYTAILFVIPIAVFFFLKLKWKFIVSKDLWIGAMIALLFVSPVLYWNIQNDFASFKYQTGHVVGQHPISWKAFITSIGSQFAGYNPLLFILAFYGFIRAIFTTNDIIRLSWLFGATMLGFFGYASLMDVTLPHWSIGFYLLFIPLSMYYLTKEPGRGRKIAFLFVGVSLPIVLFLHAELAYKFIPFPDYRSLHRDIQGWPQIMETAGRIADSNENSALKGIAVTNWSLGSRAMYYSKGRRDVFVIDKRFDQFDIWQAKDPQGFDMLFVQTHDFSIKLDEKAKCESIELASEFDITLNKRKVNTVRLEWCRNFQGLL
jgi:hypothetical protein